MKRLKLSGLRLVITGQPEMGIIPLKIGTRVQWGVDRLQGSDCISKAACVWCEGVNEGTYREERCLPAVVLFYTKKQKKRKIMFFKTSEWVFHSGFVEP